MINPEPVCIVKKSFCPYFLLPERITPGSAIIVKGKVLSQHSMRDSQERVDEQENEGNIRWAVNLVKRDFRNIVVHVVFQLQRNQRDQVQGIWFCSSRIEGVWSEVRASAETFPLGVDKSFELKILLSQKLFTVDLNGRTYFTDLPYAPFVLEDITGVLLAGQWGRVLINEVGYFVTGSIEPPPVFHGNNPLQVNPYSSMVPPQPHSINDDLSSYRYSFISEHDEENDQTQMENVALQPFNSSTFPSTGFDIRSKPHPLPQLQPDPTLTTDPYLQPSSISTRGVSRISNTENPHIQQTQPNYSPSPHTGLPQEQRPKFSTITHNRPNPQPQDQQDPNLRQLPFPPK
jgi:hypothetical protein